MHWQPPPFDPRLHSPVLQYVLEWTPVNEAAIDPAYAEAVGLETDQGAAPPRAGDVVRVEVPASDIVYTLENALPASSYSCVVRCGSKAGLSDPSNQVRAVLSGNTTSAVLQACQPPTSPHHPPAV